MKKVSGRYLNYKAEKAAEEKLSKTAKPIPEKLKGRMTEATKSASWWKNEQN